jgi:hypothetical protein
MAPEAQEILHLHHRHREMQAVIQIKPLRIMEQAAAVAGLRLVKQRPQRPAVLVVLERTQQSLAVQRQARENFQAAIITSQAVVVDQ